MNALSYDISSSTTRTNAQRLLNDMKREQKRTLRAPEKSLLRASVGGAPQKWCSVHEKNRLVYERNTKTKKRLKERQQYGAEYCTRERIEVLESEFLQQRSLPL